MRLDSSLAALQDGRLPESFAGLRTQVPLEWIETSLAARGMATVRRRKLPMEQVMWLVIGIALYRDRPIQEVVHRLDLVLPDKEGHRRQVAKGAIPPARERLGEEPLRALFGRTARQWGQESAAHFGWKGLHLFGGDGSTLRIADSAANRKAFPLHQARGHAPGYPQVRVAVIMALGSHVLWDMAFGDFRTSEQALLKPLVEQLPRNSLIVLDKGYVDGEIFQGIAPRQWLVPAKKNQIWRPVKRLGSGESLVELALSQSMREKHPEWPRRYVVRAIWYQRKGFRPRTLLTSLLDAEKYPAREIIELYHQRWELELGYDEIKTHTLERHETLRSQTPEGVRQELWGIGIAYNLVRREMDMTARTMRISPQRLSYRTSLVLIRDLFLWAATAAPGSLPKMLHGLRLDLRQLVLPPRRPERSYPREIKLMWSSYNRNNRHPTMSSKVALN
jgi:hypothetical protein